MRFLIVKTSALGDVVQTYPVVAALKQKFPEADVDWVVEKRAASLVSRHPLVTRTLEIDSRRWRASLRNFATYGAIFREVRAFVRLLREVPYDAVFDLQGNSKSALITSCCHAATKVGFGWKSAPERINCLVTDRHVNPPMGQNARRDLLFFVQTYCKDLSLVPSDEVVLRLSSDEKERLATWRAQLTAPSWMLCPGSMWANKRLSPKTLGTFLQEVASRFRPQLVLISGDEEEYALNVQLQAALPGQCLLAHRLPLPLLQHLMRAMELVISVDSMALHLAATSAVPTFSVFGPTAASKYRPLQEAHFSFQGSCPYGRTFEKRCPALRSCPTGACVKEIDAHRLFSTFVDWWEMVRKERVVLDKT